MQHKQTHTGEKPYECDVCEQTFSSKLDMTIHKRTHTGEKPYECDVCGKKFSLKSSLVAHKRIHTGERPYECDLCEKKFSEKSNLARHKRTHTGEKPNECEVCEKKFYRKSHLTRHKRPHTGEKPYECDVCNSRFATKLGHNYHKKNHLLCSSCGGEIKQFRELHKFHLKYVCNKCKNPFSTFKRMLKHIGREHGSDGNYQCGLCEELHSKEPTGVGYVCCICDVVFDMPKELEDHMANHNTT